MAEPYARDLVGYGETPPDPAWPGGARLALSFVLNYEEGAENNVLHGDAGSEAGICDALGVAPRLGQRQMTVESMFEYGSRSGVWRILRLFEQAGLPLTVFAVGMAVERNSRPVRAMADAGHEICSHGYRWIDYQEVDPVVEAEHIARSVEAIEQATGRRPVGWYTGRTSPNTRRLVVEAGGFLYDSDAYNDDLPYWTRVGTTPHLVIPYSLDANDMRTALPGGFGDAEPFFRYLRDTFDALYLEGARAPKMMSVGLHCRLAGRPARALALARFIAHVRQFDDVWITTRDAIARHWIARHPPIGLDGLPPG